MRARTVVLVTLLLVTLATCRRPEGTRNDYHDSRTFPAAAGKLVLLELRSLDADVSVVSGDTITVEVTLAARSSSRSAARRWLERNTPKLEDSPSRLDVSVPRHTGVSVFGFMHTEGRVRVELPEQCTLEVHTASGDVTITGTEQLAAPVRVQTASGDVSVRAAAKEMVLETASGDVRIAGAPLEVIEVNTASGDVRLEAGAARAVVETASGDVLLRRLAGDLSVSTASGDVDARWTSLAGSKKVRAETTSGEIVLSLPGNVAVAGEVRTNSGRIESDFPGDEDRRGRRYTLTPTRPTTGTPEAQASAPTVELDVRTNSGTVTVRKGRVEI